MRSKAIFINNYEIGFTMKWRFRTILLLFIFIMVSSCLSRDSLIWGKFQSLKGRHEIIVVIFGDSISGGAGISATGTSYGTFLKPMLETVLDCRVTMVNSSKIGDSFRSARARVQEDILSFRPDIVFFMLGFVDANSPGEDEYTYREQVKGLFDVLQKNGIFVIVLTTTGYRNFDPNNDMRYLHLKKFNEIIMWEVGLHNFPMIDVADYMERLMRTDPSEYRSLFVDSFNLNEKGQKYIAEYIMSRINHSLEKYH